MRHPVKQHSTTKTTAGELYSARLLRQLHEGSLIDEEGDSDAYVAELARRIAPLVAMGSSEEEQVEAALDWIN
jgi:hypothetical protein